MNKPSKRTKSAVVLNLFASGQYENRRLLQLTSRSPEGPRSTKQTMIADKSTEVGKSTETNGGKVLYMNNPRIRRASLKEMGLVKLQLPINFVARYAAKDECGTWYLYSVPVNFCQGIWRTDENRIDQLFELTPSSVGAALMPGYYRDIPPEDSLTEIIRVD